MNRAQQKKFVKDLLKNFAESLIRDINSGKIPETWEGCEFRWLVADRLWQLPRKGKAYLNYRNDVIVKDL